MRLDRILAVLRHPLAVAGLIVALALACLWPRLGTPGLWEPQEMAIADEAAARADGTFQPARSTPGCERQPTADDARTLTPRLAAWGLHRSSSDGGLRFPLMLLGVLGALATFGVAWRMAGARAGLVAGAVLLSFPLFVLQARMLTSEIGTAVGATLLVYGLLAIADGGRWPGAGRWAATPLGRIIDLAVAGVAIAIGAHLAFHAGGALIGLLPPLAAIAVAGAFALPALGAGLVGLWRRLDPRCDPRLAPGPAIDGWQTLAVAIATLATAGLSVWLAIEIFDLAPRTPGTRALLGHSIVTGDCWSHALGGLWRAQDDLQVFYDSTFEQVGFGLFPWSPLVPIALAALAGGLVGDDRRRAGVVLLAWSVAGWIVVSVFQRKVGYAIYPAVPAAAIAIGLLIDGLWRQRAATEPAAAGTRGDYPVAGWLLIGLILAAGLAVLDKDLAVFPDKLTTLLVGGTGIKYPANAHLLWFSLKSWVSFLAILVVAPLVLDLWLWRPSPHWLLDGELKQLAGRGSWLAVAMSVVLGLFWAQGWHPAMSRNLSSKHIFEVYRERRGASDALGIMGSMGNAPRYYADTAFETIGGNADLVTFLRRPARVFAMVPASELCSIHRAQADGLVFHVIDDENTRTLLLSNRLDPGHADKNPLATAIVREPPAGVEQVPFATYDNQIELVGVKMPAAVSRNADFEMTLIYRVKAPIGGAWQVFVHFDKGALRFNGDHWPIRQRCQTSMWQTGDYIVDRFTVNAGDPGFPRDTFDVWTGFFTGSNPNWRNMPVSSARDGTKDAVNRVKIGTIRLK